MKRIVFLLSALIAAAAAEAQVTYSVTVANKSGAARADAPVVIDLSPLRQTVKEAVVTLDGREIASQLDDLDLDGRYDELAFTTDLAAHARQTFTVELKAEGSPRQYAPRAYAQMMLHNKNVKVSNKQDLYISSLTTDGKTNPYSMVHHHGPAFESELVAYRIYFDHRQTVDLYGKRHKGLELRQTQFYPDKQQLAAGFGDDVLWAGSSFGLGALRGWDGRQPVMLDQVAHRTESVLASGPVRTIVEVIDRGWNTGWPQAEPLTMTTRYTLYQGHRDCAVDIKFDHTVGSIPFATGLTKIKGSQEYSDKRGLRGCWGANWTVADKDTLGHTKEVIGLGIDIPQEHVAKELPADEVNYAFVVGTKTDRLHYDITFCSDKEEFGFHSAGDWFAYLAGWRKELRKPVEVKIELLGH